MTNTVQHYIESLNHYSRLVRSELELEEASIISYFGLHLLASRYGNDLLLEEGHSILGAALGGELEKLQAAASHLLANPHPALVAASEAWANEPVPHMSTSVKPVPSKEALDQWASDNTMGMIEKFPLDVDPRLVVILMATAVALKTGWSTKFRKLEDGKLFIEAGGCRALGVVKTEAAGEVVILVPNESKGISVMSLIAAPEVKPARVWAAVEEVLAMGSLHRLNFITPDEDGHAWTVREENQYVMNSHSTHLQRATVPAWKAQAKHDFAHAPGLNAFQANFDELACTQTAVGEYTDEGFSAAAVTVLMVSRSMAARPQQRLLKVVDYNFDRPHALTAVVSHGDEHWQGLRLFDAWVKP